MRADGQLHADDIGDGYIVGALEGAYLSVIDADAQKIGIERYLLVNPPLDLTYSLKKLDEWDGLRYKFGAEKSKAIVAKALGIVGSFSKDSRRRRRVPTPRTCQTGRGRMWHRTSVKNGPPA